MITRFSTPRTILCVNGVQQLDGHSLAPQLVVGRDLCRFVSVDLAHVPSAQRRQALGHQIESISPWVRTGHYVVWRDGVAQLWLWDAERVDTALAGAGLSPLAYLRLKGSVRLPETIFLARGDRDGVISRACAVGWDVQRWQADILRASRWYMTQPTASDLAWFLRSQGLDGNSDTLTFGQVSHLTVAWPGGRPPPWQWLRMHRQAVAYGLGFLLVLTLSLQLTAGLRWWRLEDNYHAQSAALQASTTDLLRARGEARRESARYGQLRSLFDMPGSLASQWLVTSRMPADMKYDVVIWERVERSVEMVIAAQVSDTLGIVRALSGPGIKDVTVEPWRKAGHYSVRLRLDDLAVAQAGMKGTDVSAK